MSAEQDAAKVAKNIISIFDRRKETILALAKEYAQLMINWFRQEQSRNRFWKNATFDAIKRMFTEADAKGNFIYLRMTHGVDYGVYLEKANNAKRAAITPTMKEFTWRYLRAIQRIYKDG